MRTYLSPQVVDKIMPVYQRLASDTILERCVAGKTQNSNESLHSCIWRKCPKEETCVALRRNEWNPELLQRQVNGPLLVNADLFTEDKLMA
ncbi:hypothetical protein TNCV_3179341 [Trichonephila clavipes]|nr:hypothetical protein TNCV_3179341 [Trichonephila clavipes]